MSTEHSLSIAGRPQGFPRLPDTFNQLPRPFILKIEMSLTSNPSTTFTTPSETSTAWPTSQHREEQQQPPLDRRRQHREVEGNSGSIIILILINFDIYLHQHPGISLFGQLASQFDI